MLRFVLLLTLLILPVSGLLAADDLIAPKISAVKIASTTETSVTLTWQTDEKADSAVNYGLQPDYGIVRIPLDVSSLPHSGTNIFEVRSD